MDKSVDGSNISKVGRWRHNLAATLRKLKRFDEARLEILRAIECKSQFGNASRAWTSWDLLAKLETEAGNPAASAEAKRKAIACYLAYRRGGGETHDAEGGISVAVTISLLRGDDSTVASLLQRFAADPNATGSVGTYIRALQAIVAGSRDRTLADAPDLHYAMAAEILLLIETLESAARPAISFSSLHF